MPYTGKMKTTAVKLAEGVLKVTQTDFYFSAQKNIGFSQWDNLCNWDHLL